MSAVLSVLLLRFKNSNINWIYHTEPVTGTHSHPDDRTTISDTHSSLWAYWRAGRDHLSIWPSVVQHDVVINMLTELKRCAEEWSGITKLNRTKPASNVKYRQNVCSRPLPNHVWSLFYFYTRLREWHTIARCGSRRYALKLHNTTRINARHHANNT